MPTIGKIAIVTGSSRGIGRGIALALAARGWRIVINYRSNREAAEEVGELIKSAGSQALLVKADLNRPSDLHYLVDETLKGYGQIDLLVNNAGVGPRKRVDMLQVSTRSSVAGRPGAIS